MRIPGTKNSHEFSGHRKTEFFNSIGREQSFDIIRFGVLK